MVTSRVVDDRGRLFGKINLIDAAVGILLLLLIPVGYAAYALFRSPVPRIDTVERLALPGGKGVRLRVVGADFRPYLKVTLGTTPAAFLVESPTAGEVSAPELAPGKYDLVLYDEARELTRVPNALVVDPPFSAGTAAAPMGSVKVLGWFTGLDRKSAQALSRVPAGRGTSPTRFLPLQPPEPDVIPIRNLSNVATRVEGLFRVNAVAVVECVLAGDDCVVGDIPVRRGGVVPIAHEGQTLRFRIDEVYSTATETIDVKVRFVAEPEVLATLQRESARVNAAAPEWGVTPWFISFEQTSAGAVDVETTGVREPVRVVRATLRVPVERTTGGWKYQGSTLKIGETFPFDISHHAVRALILSIAGAPQGAARDEAP